MRPFSIFLLLICFYSVQSYALFGGLFSGSKEKFEIPIGGDIIVLEANVEGPEYRGDGSPDDPDAYGYWEFYLENIEVSVAGKNLGKLYLKSEFGWGHSPLNKVCAAIAETFGQPEIQFADGYGQLGTLSVFRSPNFLVIGKDDSYVISDSEHNGQVYYEGLSCRSKDLEY